jgi:hypothetical protein
MGEKDNVLIIEEHLKHLLVEQKKLLGKIKLGNIVIKGYKEDISKAKAKGDDTTGLKNDLTEAILGNEYLIGKSYKNDEDITRTQTLYYNANEKYAKSVGWSKGWSGGIKRKVVKRKVIPTKASRSVKPTVRKPTKPTVRKPTKPTTVVSKRGYPRIPKRYPRIPKRYPRIPKRYPRIPKRYPRIPKRYPRIPKRYPNTHSNSFYFYFIFTEVMNGY